MTTEALISLLREQCVFDPRSLRVKVPDEAFQEVGVVAKGFLNLLDNGAYVSWDSLMNDRWRADPPARNLYEGGTTDDRLQIHALICAMIHEYTHKVDMVCTPTGVMYLATLQREYQLLQTFVPHALDKRKTIPLLRMLHNITDELPVELAEEDFLSVHWPELSIFLRKMMAWGDLGAWRPPTDQIRVGWGDGVESVLHLGIGEEIEAVNVLGSLLSARRKDDQTWYMRPLMLFEARAVANTLLYILNTSPDPLVDTRAYFDAFYGDAVGDLRPDYLFVLDAVARRHEQRSFRDALEQAELPFVRHLLIMSGGLAWFSLHAPPATQDARSVLAANPVLRFLSALPQLHGPSTGRAYPSSMAEYCLQLEEHQAFKALEQCSISEALQRTRRLLSKLDGNLIDEIFDPDVRSWLRKWTSLARAQFAKREDNYISRMANPDNGNPRPPADETDLEIFYADYSPTGGMAEWLTLRREVLFSYLPPASVDAEWVKRLDAHFLAHYVPWFCPFCQGLHHIWCSRHNAEVVLTCPNTGQSETLQKDSMSIIAFPSK